MWAKDPFVVFLAETWIDKARLEQVQRRIQFKNLFVVPRCNKAEGWPFCGKKDFPWKLSSIQRIILILSSIRARRMPGGLLGFMENRTPLRDLKHGPNYEP